MWRLGVRGMLACGLAQIILLLQPAAVTAQARNSEPKHLVNRETGAVCEMNNLYIDLLVREAEKTNHRIFIISRLADGEKSILNWRRLTRARSFLTSGKEIPPDQIVTAVGQKMGRQRGRLEFYLGSELFLVSEVEKGKDVCLNCCETP